MKMDSKKMKQLLEERLKRPEWTLLYNRENDQLRVESKESKKGMSVSLPGIIAKWEERKEKAIDEIVYLVEEALLAMDTNPRLEGKESKVFPVIRSTSFPTQTNEGKPLLFEEHTAETRIYYALDLGNSYQLIDTEFVKKESWEVERIKEVARFNVRSLDIKMKQDTVAGNAFYFFNSNDGYDASRILNESLLENLKQEMIGEMAVALPHQDVLIVADIRNDHGYDILGQMAMSFFAEGRVPITALSFLYENKQLEPIFILAQKKPKKDDES